MQNILFSDSWAVLAIRIMLHVSMPLHLYIFFLVVCHYNANLLSILNEKKCKGLAGNSLISKSAFGCRAFRSTDHQFHFEHRTKLTYHGVMQF